MTGYDEFVNLFGDITVLNVLQVILAVVFLYFVYKKVRDYLIKRYEDDKKKDAQLKEALDAISKYPQYRQQSIEIQQKLESEIQGLRLAQEENNERLRKMEDAQMKLERNKLRDRLLQSYRFYTDKEKIQLFHGVGWKQRHSGSFLASMKSVVEMALCIPKFSQR